MNDIVSVITTVGFPIACCLILFWFVYHQNKDHKEEVNSLRDALENNTVVMQKLLDKLGVE